MVSRRLDRSITVAPSRPVAASAPTVKLESPKMVFDAPLAEIVSSPSPPAIQLVPEPPVSVSLPGPPTMTTVPVAPDALIVSPVP